MERADNLCFVEFNESNELSRYHNIICADQFVTHDVSYKIFIFNSFVTNHSVVAEPGGRSFT